MGENTITATQTKSDFDMQCDRLNIVAAEYETAFDRLMEIIAVPQPSCDSEKECKPCPGTVSQALTNSINKVAVCNERLNKVCDELLNYIGELKIIA